MFLFDVDGTLTPTREYINSDFKYWLMQEFNQPFALVTGSDDIKTREQIGNDLFNSITVYNCAGNHIFKQGQEYYKSSWVMDSNIESYLLNELNNSAWHLKTGNHFEKRVGLCNFSILGRNATYQQRKAYYAYDLKYNERQKIVTKLKSKFPNIEAGIAGETGIDICEKNCNKQQVLKYETNKFLHFFGDRMDELGNDYPLAKAIQQQNLGICYPVKSWQETWHILKNMKEIL